MRLRVRGPTSRLRPQSEPLVDRRSRTTCACLLSGGGLLPLAVAVGLSGFALPPGALSATLHGATPGVPGLPAHGAAVQDTVRAPVQAISLAAAQAEAARSARTDREAAIRLARAGDHDGALVILRALRARQPTDAALRGDLAAVLAWAGRDEEAVAEGEHLPFHDLDPVIAEAVARAARNVGRPGLSAALYEGVLLRAPGRTESEVGLALALKEAGRTEEALARVPGLRGPLGGNADARLAAGHIFGQAGRWVDAAAEYRQAVRLRPEWGDARVAEVLALRAAGADLLAMERAAAARAYMPPDLMNDLEAGSVARLVEWAPAATEARGQEAANARIDRALGAGTAARGRLVAVEGDDARFPEVRLRFDRIIALRDRERMVQVLAEAEALEAEGVTLPPYVLRAVADAAAEQGRTSEAVARYRESLAGWPGQPETTLGLFWALVDRNDFAEADRVLDEFLAGQPDRRHGEGLRESLPNPDRLPATVARHLGWALAGDLPRAQRGLEDLHARAPLNLTVRQELATVYGWRGWPGLAGALNERIVALDPDHVVARIGGISSALATGERERALDLATELRFLAPEAENVRRALRRVEVDALWELSARAGGGWSTGGDLGTRDRTLRTRIVSAPMAHRFRLHAGTDRADADYPEGRGALDRVAMGLEYRSRPLRLSVEGNADRDGAEAPGLSAAASFRPGDRWSFRLAGDSRARDYPLRANREGIRGWSAAAGISHRAHEGRSVATDVAWLEMTDGNVRQSAYLSLEQQVARTPRHRLALLGEGYGARNSLEGASYFNPSRTWSATGAVLWDWTLFRYRDRSYAQRASLTGGTVGQKGYGTLGVAHATVEHRWELSDRFELVYGVHAGLPVYDGVRERRSSGHLGLTWRLP
ncbi:MAG: poly-beta-1,6 N-acetyl-D-glucosamine export porin PgaA [Gemmatimonadales bacterium]|nr:MAG: poly-beta-1,6 N-acetyl-D-glucosamine export porin PgaA [Gemmatimonadales bacterium]